MLIVMICLVNINLFQNLKDKIPKTDIFSPISILKIEIERLLKES